MVKKVRNISFTRIKRDLVLGEEKKQSVVIGGPKKVIDRIRRGQRLHIELNEKIRARNEQRESARSRGEAIPAEITVRDHNFIVKNKERISSEIAKAMMQIEEVIKPLSPREKQLMEEARDHGVNVEEIIYYSPDRSIDKGGRKGIAKVRVKGVSLTSLFKAQKEKLPLSYIDKELMVFRMSEQLGLLHSIEIVHGHPHPGNFVIHDREIGIIDFKKAKKIAGLNWRDPEVVCDTFETDYAHVVRGLLGMDFSARDALDCIRNTISNYPMSPPEKEAVLTVFRKRHHLLDRLTKQHF